MSELEALFEKASMHVRNLASQLDSTTLLYLYARYKQAHDGPNNEPKPGFMFSFGQTGQKWRAWKELGDMNKEQAMEEYVAKIDSIDDSWRESNIEDMQSKSWKASVSVMAREAEASIADEAKTLIDFVKEANLSRVADLVKDNTLINVKDEQGMSAIHWAADRGLEDVLKILLSNPALDVNAQDEDGQTALHYAASCGHKSVLHLLIEAGGKRDIADCDGQKPVDVASDDSVKALLLK